MNRIVLHLSFYLEGLSWQFTTHTLGYTKQNKNSRALSNCVYAHFQFKKLLKDLQ